MLTVINYVLLHTWRAVRPSPFPFPEGANSLFLNILSEHNSSAFGCVGVYDEMLFFSRIPSASAFGCC